MLLVGSAFPSAVFADGLPLSEKSSVLTAPTAETAAALAAQTGQPVEVTGALTKTSATFINPDGTRTVDLALGPVRELDPASGSGWSSINTTLTADRTGLHPTLADVPETFSDGGADGFLAKLGLGADQLTLGWLHSLPVPVVDGNQATYRDVYPGVDLVLQARPQGFEQLWVVRQRPTGPLVFSIPLGLKGLSATTSADGSLVLTDTRTGEVKAQSDTARMWGAEVDPNADEPTHAAQVPTSVVAAGSGYALEIRPDPAFLNDPSVTYPVTIDPVVNLFRAASAETRSRSGTPTTKQLSSDPVLSFRRVGAIQGIDSGYAGIAVSELIAFHTPYESAASSLEHQSVGGLRTAAWANLIGERDMALIGGPDRLAASVAPYCLERVGVAWYLQLTDDPRVVPDDALARLHYAFEPALVGSKATCTIDHRYFVGHDRP